MGWLFTPDQTKKGMIAERTAGWSSKDRENDKPSYIVCTCLKHCYRGNNFSGVLWTVWEVVRKNRETDAVEKIDRFIGCDLLRYQDGMWGYKDMEESMGPCYYSCPLGYLDMVPVASEEWREGVREYHKKRTLSFKPKKGMRLKLYDGCSPQYVTLISVRPLRGVGDGGSTIYRIQKKYIEGIAQ